MTTLTFQALRLLIRNSIVWSIQNIKKSSEHVTTLTFQALTFLIRTSLVVLNKSCSRY